MDLAWDDDGNIWAGGGNGTLLVSRDGGESWENDPVGDSQPSNRMVFEGEHAFVLGERGTCCAGSATLCNCDNASPSAHGPPPKSSS